MGGTFRYTDRTSFATERANRSGDYSTDLARDIIRRSLRGGINPFELMAHGVQETNLGKRTKGDPNNIFMSHVAENPQVNNYINSILSTGPAQQKYKDVVKEYENPTKPGFLTRMKNWFTGTDSVPSLSDVTNAEYAAQQEQQAAKNAALINSGVYMIQRNRQLYSDPDRAMRRWNWGAPEDVPKVKEFAADLARNEVLQQLLSEERRNSTGWEMP